jgi:hypothetical protein
LVVVVGYRDDLEAAISGGVDQFIDLPETVAGKGMKMEIHGIARLNLRLLISQQACLTAGTRIVTGEV